MPGNQPDRCRDLGDDRAVSRFLRADKIRPGETTVIEKTGGNFGLGLALACCEAGVSLELAVGPGFSARKRNWLAGIGVNLIGIDRLERGATPREVVEWHLDHAATLGKFYFYTDQFNNLENLIAHETETRPEIAAQLQAWPHIRKLTFVACAGTGASLTGITRSLRAQGYEMNVVLVGPHGCDSRNGVFVEHELDGMAVGVTPPFLDWNLIGQTVTVRTEVALATQRAFMRRTGFLVGNSSAACLTVALPRAKAVGPAHRVLALAYDHGLWYDNLYIN